MIEFLVNELLFDGYSLKYLDGWYNQNVASIEKIDNIDSVIEKFTTLKRPKSKFIYYVSLLNKDGLGNDLNIGHDLKICREDYDNLSLMDTQKEEDYKKFIYSPQYLVYSVAIESMDIYKGLERVVNTIESYFQMINFLSDSQGSCLYNKIVVKVEEGRYEKMRVEAYDSVILFSEKERKEKQDIQKFIEYRNHIYAEHIESNEISNLQRALNIVKNQKEQSPENRLINLWTVLEYVLTFHEGVSIISKVKEVIPKLVCLYIFKSKLNILWSGVIDSGYPQNEVVKIIKESCRKNDDNHYDIGKLIAFILSNKELILTGLDFNDVLKRHFMEIGDFLTSKESRYKFILKKHDEIWHDIVRIYRIRNVLIHSGAMELTNLDYMSLRLYHYNNSLLGVIIYYKKLNPHSTITEILNSIEYTYNEYLKILALEDAHPIDICKPDYLFSG